MKHYKHHPWSTTPFLSNSENLNLQFPDQLWITDSSISNDILSINNFTYATKAGNTHSFQPNSVFTKLFDFLSWLDKIIEESNPTFLTIGTKKWISIFGKWYLFYLGILKELDILIRVPYQDGSWFTIGEKSCQYRITNNYKNAKDLVLVQANQPSTPKLKVGDNLILHKKFKQAIKKSTIDVNSYLQEEKRLLINGDITLWQFKIRLNMVLNTYKKRWVKSGEKVDRIYHSFSNVPKTARTQLLSPKNEKYCELDIRNCHPNLLIVLLKSRNLAIDQRYIEDVWKDRLYYRFVGVTGTYRKWFESIGISKLVTLNLTDRDKDVKPEIYSSILFHFKPKHPVAIKFKELYPITYNSIEQLHKSSTEDTVASILQNLEASIFNVLIPKYSKYFFTLHDAIYYTDPRDTETIRRRIEREFKKHGVKVKLKRK